MKARSSKVFFSITSFLCVAWASAGDEPVNCREEIVDFQDVYAGNPQCDASYTVTSCKPKPDGFDLTFTEFTITLTGNYRESTDPTVTLSDMVTYIDQQGFGPNACELPREVSETVSCTAQLAFLEERPVKEEVCDYTPKVGLTVIQDGIYETNVYAIASDRDGNVVGYEWWINDVKQSASGQSVTLSSFDYPDPYNTTIRVQVRVTDNDGYTDVNVEFATFKNPTSCPNGRC